MSPKFGQRPFPHSSVIRFTQWQTGHVHRKRQIYHILFSECCKCSKPVFLWRVSALLKVYRTSFTIIPRDTSCSRFRTNNSIVFKQSPHLHRLTAVYSDETQHCTQQPFNILLSGTTRVSWHQTTRVSWRQTTRVSWRQTTRVSWCQTTSDVNRGSKNRNSLQFRVLEIEFLNSKLDFTFW